VQGVGFVLRAGTWLAAAVGAAEEVIKVAFPADAELVFLGRVRHRCRRVQPGRAHQGRDSFTQQLHRPVRESEHQLQRGLGQVSVEHSQALHLGHHTLMSLTIPPSG
jgi:hypothetical protein